MANWIEEERERIRIETINAIHREYDRCVAAEGLEDSEAAWRGFVHGWFGPGRLISAKRELNAAGHGSYGLMVVLWLLGGMMLALMTMSYFTIPHDKLAFGRFGYLIAGSLAAIAAGFLLLKRVRRLSAEASERFHAEWGPVEKTVDEPDNLS